MTAADQTHRGLLKILGVGFGVAVSIGAVIGSGILRAPSVIANDVAGIAIIMALWIFGGVQAALSANIYAELATSMPKSGGQYVYARRVYGDLGGLVAGWSDTLAYVAGIAAASVSFAEFLPLLLPQAAAHKTAIAVALLFAIYGANISGIREGRAIQMVTSFIKAAMLFMFIVAAVLVAAPKEPALAAAASPVWSWGGIVLGYQLVFGAYAGWGVPLAFSGENTSPGRNIPRALLLGIALTAFLFVGVNAALFYALGKNGVAASPLPFTTVLSRFGGVLPATLFALTAMITVASCANANGMGASRVLFAMACDGLLPRQLANVNRGGSPVAAFLLSGSIAVALAMTGAFALVFGLIATLNMASAVLVESGFFILRRREPDLARPYRAVGYPWLPVLALLIDASVLCLIAVADMRGVAFAIGLGLLCIPLAAIARRKRTAKAASA